MGNYIKLYYVEHSFITNRSEIRDFEVYETEEQYRATYGAPRGRRIFEKKYMQSYRVYLSREKALVEHKKYIEKQMREAVNELKRLERELEEWERYTKDEKNV